VPYWKDKIALLTKLSIAQRFVFGSCPFLFKETWAQNYRSKSGIAETIIDLLQEGMTRTKLKLIKPHPDPEKLKRFSERPGNRGFVLACVANEYVISFGHA
jgi:2-oxo-4-hydroxy-4-carboxy--5-ureidoimidazoline (OHCU) decarboxylase